VCRVEHLGCGLLAELNHSGGGNDAVAVSQTVSDIEMRDHDSSSSADSKEGSVDIIHFIEVNLSKGQCIH